MIRKIEYDIIYTCTQTHTSTTVNVRHTCISLSCYLHGLYNSHKKYYSHEILSFFSPCTRALCVRQGRGPKQRSREEPLADEQRSGRKDVRKREGGKPYSSSVSIPGSKQKVNNVFGLVYIQNMFDCSVLFRT